MGWISLLGRDLSLAPDDRSALTAAGVLFVVALWGFVHHTERLVHFLFPYLEWEHTLGWLNIRAQRRAEAALRILGSAIQLLLAATLPVMAWGIQALPLLRNWPDPWVMGDLAVRIPVLLFCSGLWLIYLGAWILPRRKMDRERRALRRYRAALRAAEPEFAQRKPVPSPKPLLKPRQAIPLAPSRLSRRGR